MENTILFFATPEKFRSWLEKNHKIKTELWVGYYKVSSGKKSITWSESVDQALCYGWIDGIRKTVDEESYKIRFTPRKPKSNWSVINLKKIKELKKKGLMKEAGIEIFDKRDKNRTTPTSYEQKGIILNKEFEDKIKENKKAWEYFNQLAPSYKKQSIWWLMSAKKEETKINRLNILIESCERELKIPPLRAKK